MFSKLKSFFSYVGECVVRELPFFIISVFLLSMPAAYEGNGVHRHFAVVLLTTSIPISMLISTLACILVRLGKKYVKWLIMTLWLLLFITETFIYFRFGSRMSPIFMSLILQTDMMEVKEFFTTFLTPPILVSVGIGLVFLLFLYIKIEHRWKRFFTKIPRKLVRVVGMIVTANFLLGGFLIYLNISSQWQYPIGTTSIEQIIDSYGKLSNHDEDVENIYKANLKIEKVKSPSKSPIIVCILGESFNRYHSSLYGYGLPTNPLLEQEVKAERLFVFTDVVSSFQRTNKVLETFYSLKSVNDTSQWNQNALFPAVFRKAGFKVGLFDNQSTRTSGSMRWDFSCAYYINPHKIHKQCFNYRNTMRYPHDGDFIQTYSKKFYHTPKSLNIIHLMGQHINFSIRYPNNAKWKYFSESDIKSRNDLNSEERTKVAEYANVTRYNDAVVKQIIDLFRTEDAVIVYCSDHGEQIYDDNRHLLGRTFGNLGPLPIKCMHEIPFMIWVSDKFKEAHPEKVKQIAGAVNQPFSNDDICYLLFDLADIDFKGNQPDRSVINPLFKPRHRILKNGEQNYDYDAHKAEIDRVQLITSRQVQ